eukprot:s335_g17.t1
MSCHVEHGSEEERPAEQNLGEACQSDEESTEQALPEPPGLRASEMFTDLFRWPRNYAQKILKSASPHAVSALLKHDFVHHESFAGTGSAGIALHMIHKAFCDELRRNRGGNMDAEETKAAQAEYGQRMLDRFMKVLRQANAYKLHTPCTFRSHQPGDAEADEAGRVQAVAKVDVFFVLPREAVIVHECTGGFLRWVLTTYLPEWDWHCLVKDGSSSVPSARVNDTDTDSFLLSPHMVGWPLNRPRLFEVGTLRGTCFLEPCETDPCSEAPGESAFAAIGELFQTCKLDCSALMVAHEDFWLKDV